MNKYFYAVIICIITLFYAPTAYSIILYENSEQILKDLSYRGNGRYTVEKGNTTTDLIIDGNVVEGLYYSDTEESYIFCFKGLLQEGNIIVGSGGINTLEDSNITEPLGEYKVDNNLTIVGRQISKDGMLTFESIALDLSEPDKIDYIGESNGLGLSCPL